MGAGARLNKSSDKLGKSMSDEEKTAAIMSISEGRGVLVRFGPEAGQDDVAALNDLVVHGRVGLDDPMRIELQRVASYSGEHSCWGSCPQRTARLKIIEHDLVARAAFEGLAPVLSHVVVQ